MKPAMGIGVGIIPGNTLVQAPIGIVSSYPLGATRDEAKLLHRTSLGYCTQAMFSALLQLDESLRGCDFRVTDLYRSADIQAAEHQKWKQWQMDKANSATPFEPKRHRKDYAAPVGRSFHGAGLAVDINLEVLTFKGVPKDKFLDTLWEHTIKVGLTPIIKAPTEGTTEAWHFDLLGPWEKVRAKRGYAQAALGATLVISNVPMMDTQVGRLQAHLHRAGFDCGTIDGLLGPNTLGDYTEAVKRLGPEPQKWPDSLSYLS